MTDSKPSSPADGCAGCTLGSRREFLVDALRASAAALMAIGLAPNGAEAMPLRWISALASKGEEKTYPVPATDGVQIDKDNEVILVRYAGAAYAFALSCPHQNTALRWLGDDSRFQCPKHKSKYQPDGTFMSGKATRNMDRYAVSKKGKLIVVDLGVLIRSDKEPERWAGARLTLPK